MKPGLKQLLLRSSAFLGAVLIIRLTIQLIFSNRNLYKYIANEAVNLVNNTDVTTTLFFSVLAFAIYERKNLLNIEPYHVRNRFLFIAISLTSLALHYLYRLFTTTSTSYVTGIIRLLLLLLFGGFLFLACYGVEFVKKFKKSLIIFLIVGTIYYFITHYVQYLWVFFVKIVSKILYFMLSLFYSDVVLKIESSWSAIKAGGGPTLGVGQFIARIGPPCSGVDSLLMFTSLYALIFSLDYKRLKLPLTIILFFVGAIGMFFTNILRIFLLYLVGIEISPELAVGLFHTNVGWILFILYFFLFWWIASKFVYKKKTTLK